MKTIQDYYNKYNLIIIIVIFNIGVIVPIYSQGSEVQTCGFPSQPTWTFEDIFSCNDIGCQNTNPTFGTNRPELGTSACACGPTQATASFSCNYFVSHGTPFIHSSTTTTSTFGAMSAVIAQDGIRSEGEGIFFCSQLYEQNRCINLEFDLIIRQDFHYALTSLEIKLANPNFLTPSVPNNTFCLGLPPNVGAQNLQTIASLPGASFAANNHTQNLLTRHLSFSFYPNSNVLKIEPAIGTHYNLWFYFLNFSHDIAFVGIDNISLSFSDNYSCEEDIYLDDDNAYGAGIEGVYYANNTITISSTNDLPIVGQSEFNAGNWIEILPNSVFTKIQSSQYVLMYIEDPNCPSCIAPEPPPYITNKPYNDAIALDNILINKVFNSYSIDQNIDSVLNNEASTSNENIKMIIYNVYGQIVYSGPYLNTDESIYSLNGLPLGIYYVNVFSNFSHKIVFNRKLLIQ